MDHLFRPPPIAPTYLPSQFQSSTPVPFPNSPNVTDNNNRVQPAFNNYVSSTLSVNTTMNTSNNKSQYQPTTPPSVFKNSGNVNILNNYPSPGGILPQKEIPKYGTKEENIHQATELANHVISEINYLIEFMGAIDFVQFSSSTFFLTETTTSLVKFTKSLEEPTYPSTSLPLITHPPSSQPDSLYDWKSTTLNDFNILQTIGTGTFGSVKLCEHKQTHEYFCVKILSKEKILRLKQQQHVLNEKNILFKTSHPFIVKLYKTIQDHSTLYFIMEYVSGGELFTEIKKHGVLSPDVTKFYAAEIVLIIEYLHNKNIIHRDLKPENLLLGPDGHLKLTDFGFAQEIQDRTFTMCGTPEYIAPEIIQGKGHGKGVDWWCLGILIYEMLVGQPPFQGDNNYNVFTKILEGNAIIPPHVDPVIADFISKLLVIDITKRLGCLKGGTADVKAHVWFNGLDWDRFSNKLAPGVIVPKQGGPGDTSNYFVDNSEAEEPILPYLGDQEIFANF